MFPRQERRGRVGKINAVVSHLIMLAVAGGSAVGVGEVAVGKIIVSIVNINN